MNTTKATNKNWIKISRGVFAHISLDVKVVKRSVIAQPYESQSGWLVVEGGENPRKTEAFETKWAAMSHATRGAEACHLTECVWK